MEFGLFWRDLAQSTTKGWIQSFGSRGKWIEPGGTLPEMGSPELNFCAHFEALKGTRDPSRFQIWKT
jgi:hypothetical protein